MVELPNDPHAERAVIAAVLRDGSVLYDAVAAIVRPSDFHDPMIALAMEAIADLAKRRVPIDLTTVASELRARDRLNTVGGIQSLSDWCDLPSPPVHTEAHARTVAELSRVRAVVRAAQAIVLRGSGPVSDPAAFASEATVTIARAAEQRTQGSVVGLDDAVMEAMERLEQAAMRGDGMAGMTTSLRDLDELTGGLCDGQLIIIAGRPGSGKTSLATQLAGHVAENHGPVMFFSLEMPRAELSGRMIAGRAGVDFTKMRKGRVTPDEMDGLAIAGQKLFRLPLFIDDCGDLTLLQLRAASRRVRSEHGLRLIVVDYLQLMKGSRDRMESREQEVSEITRGLKSLAKELGLPIIALSQLNRSTETRSTKDKRPQLSDLRESGAIEQDADNVMFVYRDEVYHRDTADKGIAELIVAKQRNGPTDTVRVRFIGAQTRFVNIAEEHGYAHSTHDGGFQ